MEGRWDITLGGEKVGVCTGKREGLYCLLSCRCRLPQEKIYRILLCAGEEQIRLGIPVPGEGGYVLHTRLPIRRIPEGEIRFIACEKSCEGGTKFIPLKQGEPFPYLRQLPRCRLGYRDGELGVLFPDEP